ncbi:Muskelin N-terminus-domain-containing protein [Polychytrium aggregatum]|uniref:Muskelin N-terminus-domain-containing protein n=1 Tax=Polychytrium aggregatum TaxID=110093 RepID=UPI0022FF44EF|nr:Muskelin N-terminus-domain-containing protein [Polychytrium aggregatum]KAI9205394.1 Muskelin N-terminus-domain-containing protein [Polychytrium aggregatum]
MPQDTRVSLASDLKSAQIAKPPLQPAASQALPYTIHDYSSYSANFLPEKIKQNSPQDQSSRWASGSHNQLQFITLKLDRISIVHTITFGKFHKVHVCNLKEFKVYGGLTPNSMFELLHGGLRNDTEPETFSLKFKANGVYFPCQYIKIAPLLAWGANFNFSIWFVELRGISQSEPADQAYAEYMNYRENEVVRLCLKHFRQRNQLEIFESIQRRTKIKLEDPLLTDLHRHLVVNGDFAAAEDVIQDASQRSLFQDWIRRSVSSNGCKPVWKRIQPATGEGCPSSRGGHQMCIDAECGRIYLFGGWDGSKDLADFWVYDRTSLRWRCISPDTRRQGGPGPRSCHKVCIDTRNKIIYTLGRYIDTDHRPIMNLDADFWKYDVSQDKWTKISEDTTQEGGPDLIFDHQMVIEESTQVIYVFGGRRVQAGQDANQSVFSGLYAYNIRDNRWSLLREDTTPADHAVQMKSRVGHSMLLSPETRELYIFAGQRSKDYLSDFYVYNIESDTVHEVSRDYSKKGGPNPGYTQRATIDQELGELYVMSGLMKDKMTSNEQLRNTFWIYNIKLDTWTRVYHNDSNPDEEYWERMADKEPRPRFAHQLVYDWTQKVQYMFGGNPGLSTNPGLRLNDFWALSLQRPRNEDILRHARFFIRKQKFREMCVSRTHSPQQLLHYLQNDLSEVVDHADPHESKSFRELTSWLFMWNTFKGPGGTPLFGFSDSATAGGHPAGHPSAQANNFGAGGMVAMGTDSGNLPNDIYSFRTELYSRLIEYFPEEMREPKQSLVDLVPII